MSKYHEYMASRDWALKREEVLKRNGGKCERCCLFNIHHVHHLTYANKFNEKPEDLQGLCHQCHDFVSGKSDVDPRGMVATLAISEHAIKCLAMMFHTGDLGTVRNGLSPGVIPEDAFFFLANLLGNSVDTTKRGWAGTPLHAAIVEFLATESQEKILESQAKTLLSTWCESNE